MKPYPGPSIPIPYPYIPPPHRKGGDTHRGATRDIKAGFSLFFRGKKDLQNFMEKFFLENFFGQNFSSTIQILI